MRSSECLHATQLWHSWQANLRPAATSPGPAQALTSSGELGQWAPPNCQSCSLMFICCRASCWVPKWSSQLTACCGVCRGGWKGRPVVALGKREGLPMGLHPLISFVARPVKHTRLAIALLKAMALMRSKAQHVPLHPGTRVSAAASAASEAFNVQGRGTTGQQRRLGPVQLSEAGLLSSLQHACTECSEGQLCPLSGQLLVVSRACLGSHAGQFLFSSLKMLHPAAHASGAAQSCWSLTKMLDARNGSLQNRMQRC